MKRRKALVSEEEFNIRDIKFAKPVSKFAKPVRKLLKHVSRLCTGKKDT